MAGRSPGGSGSRWSPVRDFEDLYEVCDRGTVRRIGGDFLRPFSRSGYPSVSLKNGRRRATRCVHAIVAEAFLGPRPNGMQVAHLDGDKCHNAVENLAYVTPAENEAHKRNHGTFLSGGASPSAKLTDEQAAIVREIAAAGIRQSRIAALLGVGEDAISRIVRELTYAD